MSAPATILIVDDEPANLRLLIDLLLREGYQLTVAESGLSALERAHFRRPDLVLLDVQMPGIDGYETCRRLLADPALGELPVIFLSVLDEATDKRAGFAAGGVDYVTKPIDPAEVLLRVRAQLTLQTLRRELAAANTELEQRVAARTAALAAEIERRRQSEEEKAVLLAALRVQTQQLERTFGQLRDTTAARHDAVASELEEQIAQSLTLAQQELAQLTATAPPPAALAHVAAAQRLLDEALGVLAMVTLDLRYVTSEALLNDTPLARLTARERAVLHLLRQQLGNEAIAEQLHISAASVRTYRHRIMRKLGGTDPGNPPATG